MSRHTGKAASSREEINIRDLRYLANGAALIATDPLALYSQQDIADILFFELTSSADSKDLQRKLNPLYTQYRMASETFRAQNLQNTVVIHIEKLELKSILYRLIHDNLARAARPECAHYAILSYNESIALEAIKKKSPDLPDYEMACHYNYFRSLEILTQNSREIRVKIFEGYRSIIERYKDLFAQGKEKELPTYVHLCFLKTLVMGGETFEDILGKLASMRTKAENFSYMIPLIDAQDAWVRLCQEASRFKVEEDNPKLKEFLDYIKLKSSQEFLSLKESNVEKKLLVAGSEDERKLFDLVARYEELQNNSFVISKGVNTLSIDKSAKLLRIIASDESYQQRYLESLEKNDNEALFDFYFRYDDLILPLEIKKYSENLKSRYLAFTKKPAQYFLEAAAWSGNAEAQHATAKKSLRLAETSLKVIPTIQNEAAKQNLTRYFYALKEKWYKFLALVADNEKADAKFEYAKSIELGRVDVDAIGCIPYQKEGLEYKYYLEAAALGHEGAKAKMAEVDEKVKNICANLARTTPQDIEYLRAIAEYGEYKEHIPAIISFCLSCEYGGLKGKATAESVADRAKEIIAIHHYDREDRDGFDRLLNDDKYRLEILGIFDARFQDSEAVASSLEKALGAIIKIRDFYQAIPKVKKVNFFKLKQFIEKSLNDLAAKGVAKAAIAMAAIVNDEVAASIGEDDDVDGFKRKQARFQASFGYF